MIMYREDTIAAIASGVTNSGISIIRVSGPESVSAVSKIFKSKGTELEKAESHTVHYGFIMDGERIVDEVLVLLFRAPKTYTREDVVEIDCHGGSLITEQVLRMVLSTGVRHAEPGEFTKRAFLNGRIDLSQAESVMEVIGATNRIALKQSINQLRGSVKNEIKRLRDIILNDVAYIEAALDDPEHISIDEYRETLSKNALQVLNDINKLIGSFGNGRLIKEGIDTVILGRPNAGKSTLLNNLSGEERAIVTEIAGTTRDLLEVPIVLDGMQLNITDTAGLRDTDDPVEKIGVSRARKKADEADLLLYLIDGAEKINADEIEYIRSLKDRPCIVLINKSDISGCTNASEMSEKYGIDAIELSAKEGLGIDKLKSEIKRLMFGGQNIENEPLYVTNERHLNALTEAKASMEKAIESIDSDMPEDFISIDLMGAYETLGKIIGETPEEDLVNRIFEKFCMGK